MGRTWLGAEALQIEPAPPVWGVVTVISTPGDFHMRMNYRTVYRNQIRNKWFRKQHGHIHLRFIVGRWRTSEVTLLSVLLLSSILQLRVFVVFPCSL
jgi:hypothetical protein